MFSDPPPLLLLLILILISRHSETLLPPLLRAPCAHQLWQHCLPTNCALALQIRERAYKICSASILQNRFRFVQSYKQLLFDHLLDYIFFNFISFISLLSFQLSKLLLNTSKYCQLWAGHSHSRVRLTSYTKIHLHRAVVVVVSLLLLLLFIHHLLAVFVNWFISKACL